MGWDNAALNSESTDCFESDGPLACGCANVSGGNLIVGITAY